MRKSFLLHALLQLADFYTTKAAFKLSDENRKVRETNPFVRRFTDHGKWEELFLLKLASLGVPWLLSKLTSKDKASAVKNRQDTLSVLNTVYSLAVVNNIMVIIDLLKPREFPYNEITSQDY